MIPVKILSLRYLPGAEPGLARALGAPQGYPSLAMLTTDCDDATYIALDAATKAADVQVCYARSFYAGAANASMFSSWATLLAPCLVRVNTSALGMLFSRMRWVSSLFLFALSTK